MTTVLKTLNPKISSESMRRLFSQADLNKEHCRVCIKSYNFGILVFVERSGGKRPKWLHNMKRQGSPRKIIPGFS